jgi:ATP-binding cassette subfamily C protein
MDVFAILLTDTGEGTRRYLFSVRAGEALFAMPVTMPALGHSYKILAVAISAERNGGSAEPTLISLTPTEPNLVGLALQWCQHFNTVLLAAGISIAPMKTIKIDDWKTLQSNLANLHVEFLEGLAQLEQQESDRKRVQVQARERFDRQVATLALRELTSVLCSEEVESFPEETALLTAVGAVGRSLGIPIYPPTQSTPHTDYSLDAIARASHIRTRRILLEDNWWNRDYGAFLGYREVDNCPIAVLPQAAGKYELFNPETQTRIPLNKHTAGQLSPSADVFYRPLPHRVNRALDLLQFALAGRVKEGWTILWTGIAVTGLGMLTPQAIAILVDVAIPDANQALLLQLGLGLLAASVGAAVFQLLQRRMTVRLQTIADLNAQSALWDHLLKLKLSFFRQYSTGDLQNRVLSIKRIRDLLGGVTLSTIFTSCFALLNLALLFFYSTHLAIVAAAITIVTLLATHTVRLTALKSFRSLQELEGALFGTMTQIIGGVAKLRVAGAENRAFAYWSKVYNQQLRLTLRIQSLEDLLFVFNTLLPTVSSIILFALAVSLMDRSQVNRVGLSTGTFLAFNVAFGSFINGATNLSSTIAKILEARILWERMQPVLKAEPEVDWSKADPGQLQGNLNLDRVTFRYRAEGRPVLAHITLEAKAGEFIALVGPSGSGKSTLLRLLLGFETPEAGTVYYDGQDLSGLDLSAVRRQLGVVLQHGRINSSSLFENIANGALVTLDQAWDAARLAGLAEDIQTMPMGMHTVIAEGGLNLSGGQRQRLLIARALVLKPQILLMDEATSALDNRTQEIVSHNLEQLRVTRLIIAHRLSTIRHAHRIYVLEQGQIVQQGSFKQLSNQSGLFQKLMARQMT